MVVERITRRGESSRSSRQKHKRKDWSVPRLALEVLGED